MNVWLIKAGEVLPLNGGARRMRTALLAGELRKRGHSVLWWTSAFDHFKKRWIFHNDTQLRLDNGVDLKVLKGIGYKKNISLARWIDHRIIARKFGEMAKTMPVPDIIVTSTPPYDLAYECVMFAKEKGIPVIVDIRDEWPDSFLESTFIGGLPKAFQRLCRAALRKDFQMIEGALQEADGLVSMMDSLLRWGMDYAGRRMTWKDRVFHIGCSRDAGPADPGDKLSRLLESIKGKFVATFVGTLGANNDPGVVIECARIMKNDEIVFVIAGDGELFEKLKAVASGLWNVIFTGWLDQSEITALLRRSHIGLCPAGKIRDAFPNKVFVYSAEGLPVVSAWQGELKEMIERYEMGFYFPPNDCVALALIVGRLHEDRLLYKKMSANSKRVFDELWDADKIYAEYATYVENVALKA